MKLFRSLAAGGIKAIHGFNAIDGIIEWPPDSVRLERSRKA
ncbi:hypothetical protein [Endozoicomonas acroporae]|nr:hypothetical protein [Endozoicomonas acroporae]